ncbi:hypothetical protein GF351_01690 [Candidatus Woesearchaeota archaeon]|nr:hypothetical protein [Candidatus Woesearchaeota archaeon]
MYNSNCAGCENSCSYESIGGTTSLDSSIKHQEGGKVQEDYLANSKYDADKGDDIMSKDYQKLEEQEHEKEKGGRDQEMLGQEQAEQYKENEQENRSQDSQKQGQEHPGKGQQDNKKGHNLDDSIDRELRQISESIQSAQKPEDKVVVMD